MRYFSTEDARAWRNNLYIRSSKDDACASLRIFIRQVDKWLQGLPLRDFGLLWVDFDPAMQLKEDIQLVNDFFSEHFIILGKDAAQSFIQRAEGVAGYFLENRLDIVWQEFCAAMRQRWDCSAFDNTQIALNGLEKYFMSRQADPILLHTFRQEVSISWPYMRSHVLARGYEFVPSHVIASLWCALADFVQDAREDLQVAGRWWTDVEDGQFRLLRASERAKGGTATTSAEMRNGDIAGNIITHISDLRDGRIPEARILDVLNYLLKASDELARAMDAASARRKAREKGKHENKRMSDRGTDWALERARFLLNAYPAMTLSKIAKLLASKKERDGFAAKLANPEAKALWAQDPPRELEARRIRDKLYAAVEDGRIVMPASNPA
ncbi:MAG: hypothetical protein WAN43_14335 [Rhodomicrobium sp.]